MEAIKSGMIVFIPETKEYATLPFGNIITFYLQIGDLVSVSGTNHFGCIEEAKLEGGYLVFKVSGSERFWPSPLLTKIVKRAQMTEMERVYNAEWFKEIWDNKNTLVPPRLIQRNPLDE